MESRTVRTTWHLAATTLLVVAVNSMAATTSVAAVSARLGQPAGVRPVPAVTGERLSQRNLPEAPSTQTCQALFSRACYTPTQLRTAYGVTNLAQRDLTGAGRTIAIVDAFGSPTLSHDLHLFDQAFGLSDPPELRVITPAGPPPTFDPADEDMSAWALETTLDVEYAHAIAPGADILLVVTPISETEGVQGFPEIATAEKYVIDHGLADVISQSFGATEDSFPDRATLLEQRSAVLDAARRGVTMVAAAGDTGSTGYEIDTQTLYPTRVVTWPASDPLVTGVGAAQLFLDDAGHRVAPDVAWNDAAGASGGGRSDVFARPSYQAGVAAVVGSRRGVPDIAMAGAVDGGAAVYSSYDPADVGWSVVGGSSEATPIFAALVAIAAQAAHHRLGVLGPALYGLGGRNGLVDIVSGSSTFAGVAGYDATRGYDLVTGLGTVDAARFVPALVQRWAAAHR